MSKHDGLPVIGLTPKIVSRIPRPYGSPQELGASIDRELRKVWLDLLPDKDRAAYEAGEDVPFDVLDSVIVQQASTMGWRILLSQLVHSRMEYWSFSHDGPARFKKLGDALAKSARIIQRFATQPVDPEWAKVKAETIPELKLLLKSLQTTFASSRSTPAVAAVIGQFRSVVLSEPETFGHIATDLSSWLLFLDANPLIAKSVALAEQRVEPASLWEEYMSWRTGLQPETIRQQSSRRARRFTA